MALRTLDSLGSLAGKRVIVRCDLNVPLKDGVITDDGRVRASLPTLNALINQGARVVVCSHLGRPDGAPDPKYSLAPVAQRLSELLGKPVAFARDTVGESAADAVAALEDGDVAVIENLRFNPGETAKDDAERGAFAAQLAELGDALVSDGFGVVHRKQASVYDLAEILPSAAGFLIEKEVEVLDRLTENPERPVHGRARRIEGQRQARRHRAPPAARRPAPRRRRHDVHLPRGRGPQGRLEPPRSRISSTRSRATSPRRRSGASSSCSPSTRWSRHPSRRMPSTSIAPASAIEDTAFGASGLGLDIGPETATQFAAAISDSKTVFWNGPMGVFEMAGVRGGHQDGRGGAHRRSTACRSSAAATPPRPCVSSASRTTSSATSRPAGARASSSSKARSSPDWRSSDGSCDAARRSSQATGR